VLEAAAALAVGALFAGATVAAAAGSVLAEGI
jgi:hypothetical protein